ncbi:hypothetical protein BDQ17DRAFT_1246514 [Cyathus striatus]|nr:hypothetical protein BDQ17DRAFT_1246514 [Cyathus striatus]
MNYSGITLVGRFARSFARALEQYPYQMDGWRVPGLGITVVGMSLTLTYILYDYSNQINLVIHSGPDIKFYAIIALDTRFRLISLTPSLSCIESAAEGSDRDALYRAFTAASVLLTRIDQDAEFGRFYKGLSRFIRLPCVSRLHRWQDDSETDDYIYFRIIPEAV